MVSASVAAPPGVAVDFCLVSPGLPSSNPRLVKEAAALVRAGYRVHCVVGDYPTPLREYDAALIAETGATMTRVTLGSRVSYRLRRVLQMVCSRSLSWAGDRMLASACSPQSLRLAAAAAAVPASLYIGHTLAGLPAAVLAARSRFALAGFDAEDCHSEENENEETNRTARAVERRFLPLCVHRTAAAPLIAEEYQKRHGLSSTTILNCFDRPESFRPAPRQLASGRPLSFYWFSQTIGPGRGLEQIIAGAGVARARVQLCFRGIVRDDYRSHLVQIGRQAGLLDDVQFLPPDHPDRMIPAAAEHDVGLSLELRQPRNRDLCLTNKLFTYLAAGIPQIVSRTAAQEAFSAELGAAAVLVELDHPASVAAAIDALADPDSYVQAAAAADRLYATRYSWTAESVRLVAAVKSLYGANSSVGLEHCGQPQMGGLDSRNERPRAVASS